MKQRRYIVLGMLISLIASVTVQCAYAQILNSKARMIVPPSSNGSAEIPFVNEYKNENTIVPTRARGYISYDAGNLIYEFSIPAFKDYRLRGSATHDDNDIWKTNDHVEIFIQSKPSAPYYQYVINTAGGVYDSRNGDVSWNGHADVEVNKDQGIWNIKVAIPFSDLDYKSHEKAVLPGNVAVVMQSLPPTAVEADNNSGRFSHTWAATGATFVNPSSFGKWVLSSKLPFVKKIDVQCGNGVIRADYIIKNQSSKKEEINLDNKSVILDAGEQRAIRQEIKLTEAKIQIVDLAIKDIFNYQHYYTNQSAISFDLVAGNWETFRINILNPDKISKDVRFADVRLDGKNISRLPVPQLSKKNFKLKRGDVGSHTIELVFRDSKRKILAQATKQFQTFSYPERKHELADLDVSKNYPPVRYENGIVYAAKTKYVLREGVFPASIFVNGENILMSPIVLKYNSKAIPSPKLDRVIKANKNQVVLGGKSVVDGRVIEIRADYQYDGFVWCDVRISGNESFPYGRLELDVPLVLSDEIILGQSRKLYDKQLRVGKEPLSSGYTKEYMSYTDVLGADFTHMSLPYSSLLWLGTDENKKYRGICFVNEGPKGWNLKRYDTMYSISRVTEDTYNFRVNISDGEKAYRTSKINVSFGLMTFPMRIYPEKPSIRYDHTFSPDNYSKKYKAAKAEGKKTFFFDRLNAIGANVEVAHEYWTEYHNYWKTKLREKDLKEYVRAAHEMDVKVIFYFGFLISNKIPEFPLYHNLFLNKPTKYPKAKGFEHYLYYKIGDPQQSSYSYCHNSVWPDRLMTGIEEVIKEYNIDGVYLDGGFAAGMCCNGTHGCGTKDPYGRLVPTSPVRRSRRTLEMLYSIGQKHCSDFIIDSAMNHPQLVYWGLVSTFYVGECSHLFDVRHSRMSPSSLRGWLNGALYGIPEDLLLRPPYNIDLGWSQSMLVNANVRLAMGGGERWCKLTKKIWDIKDKYNLQEKDFVPYFIKDKKITSSNPEVLISYYDTKDVIVIVASNYWNEKTAGCEINLSELAGARNGSCDDIWSGKTIQINNGKIETEIKPLSMRIIVIEK